MRTHWSAEKLAELAHNLENSNEVTTVENRYAMLLESGVLRVALQLYNAQIGLSVIVKKIEKLTGGEIKIATRALLGYLKKYSRAVEKKELELQRKSAKSVLVKPVKETKAIVPSATPAAKAGLLNPDKTYVPSRFGQTM